MTNKAPTEDIKLQKVFLDKLDGVPRAAPCAIQAHHPGCHIAPPNGDETWCGEVPPTHGAITVDEGSATTDASQMVRHCRPIRQPDRQPVISNTKRREMDHTQPMRPDHGQSSTTLGRTAAGAPVSLHVNFAS